MRSAEDRPITVQSSFGLRKVAPCACVADKRHIQDFFGDALEEFGFVVRRWEGDGNLDRVLGPRGLDLFVLGLSEGGVAAANLLEGLAARQFAGKVLVFGQPASPMVEAVQKYGGELGLDMLPLLSTPFHEDMLRQRVALLLPAETPPSPQVDVGEALHANWLELWYQPKVEIRSFTLCGAEALVRMRHPTWGIVKPAAFIPDEDDPDFVAFSDFVLSRALADWHYFVAEYGHLEIAVNLPISFLARPNAIRDLAAHLPRHPAFGGAVVEINATDLVRNIGLVGDIAERLRFYNLAVSIDDLASEWPALLELEACPFAEIKVDRALIAGCADDALKRSVCRRIVALADRLGARTVAEGVENRPDFVAVRELGFDVVQGFFLAKPMEARKFARRVLRKPLSLHGTGERQMAPDGPGAG